MIKIPNSKHQITNKSQIPNPKFRLLKWGMAIFFLGGIGFAENIKPAEFAGSFYPQEKEVLNSAVNGFIEQAEVAVLEGEILGVIAPHAGYVYSGAIAGHSYKVLQGREFDTVILLGAAHHAGFEGVRVYPQGAFEVPCGVLEIDEQLARQFSLLDFVQLEEEIFYKEHSLEVQLPFILKFLNKVEILPVFFGEVTRGDLEKFAEKLEEVSKEKKILVLVSTDLSHYLPYEQAIKIDSDTVEVIKNKDIFSLWSSWEKKEGRACALCPVITLLMYAQNKNADIEILSYANSGDTAGDKSAVVGYLSAAVYVKSNQKNREQELKEAGMEKFSLNDDEKKVLLTIARRTLESFLKDGTVPDIRAESENLKQERGAFVTLYKQGELRGCIGRIAADMPLYQVISEFAINAAVNDSRFPEVSYEELADIKIEISVLTPFQKVENLEEIQVGTHGLMIKKGFNSGLLLPQVPGEYGWDKKTFLEHTCIKAGLPTQAYKDKDSAIFKFSAIVFSEEK